MHERAFGADESHATVVGESKVSPTEHEANDARAALAQLMSELARGLAAEPDLDATLTGITAAVAATIPRAAHAGITRGARHDRVTAQASTDAVADKLAQLQIDLQHWPSIAALLEHHVISIANMAVEDRWPDFAAAAARLGVASMLSLQLFVEDQVLGALNLYATTPDGFTADDQAIAEVLAAHAAIALRDADIRQQLSKSIASRDVIGQAKGILMARHHVTAEAAFDMLVTSSQQTNLKLVDVARRLVDEHEHPSPGSSPVSRSTVYRRDAG